MKKNGNDRLQDYILAHLPKLQSMARRGLIKSPGALIFAVDEEFSKVCWIYAKEEDANRIAEKTGILAQYQLMAALCLPVRCVPLLAELHTKDDVLFYAVTQIWPTEKKVTA